MAQLDDVEGGLTTLDVADPALAAPQELAEIGLAELAGLPQLTELVQVDLVVATVQTFDLGSLSASHRS